MQPCLLSLADSTLTMTIFARIRAGGGLPQLRAGLDHHQAALGAQRHVGRVEALTEMLSDCDNEVQLEDPHNRFPP